MAKEGTEAQKGNAEKEEQLKGCMGNDTRYTETCIDNDTTKGENKIRESTNSADPCIAGDTV